MIIKGIFRLTVFPETFIPPVVMMVYFLTGPVVVAFDTKMIVRLSCKGAASIVRFNHPLGKSYTCRDTCPLHLIYSNILITPYICIFCNGKG